CFLPQASRPLSILETLPAAIARAFHVCGEVPPHDPHRRSTGLDNTRRILCFWAVFEAAAADLLQAPRWRRQCVLRRIQARGVYRESRFPLCARVLVIRPC